MLDILFITNPKQEDTSPDLALDQKRNLATGPQIYITSAVRLMHSQLVNHSF